MQDEVDAITKSLADALKTAFTGVATAAMTASVNNGAIPTTKPPPFTIQEFRASDNATVEDYFKRFNWALELSRIPAEQHANYARVHMGAELNSALKFLVAPRTPESQTYESICKTLITHFDTVKNKYAESVKFRHVIQQQGESIASFALRLRQAATHCEYGEFLDRMLVEQMLHGLDDRDMCDEIIQKKPNTFAEAYEVAHSLESTRQTTQEVKNNTTAPESTNMVSGAHSQFKKNKKVPPRRPAEHAPGREQIVRKTSPARKVERTNQRGLNTCYGCGGSHRRSNVRTVTQSAINAEK